MRRTRKSKRKRHDFIAQYFMGVAIGLTVGLLLIFIQWLWQ